MRSMTSSNGSIVDDAFQVMTPYPVLSEIPIGVLDI
jgi:hypothetical protein